MHKKITSMLLVIVLVFGMMSSALPVFAEGEDVTYTKANAIEDGKTYVIVAEGMGMTAQPHDGYNNKNNYTYLGFAGTSVTVTDNNITSTITEDMLWTAESVDRGFAFKNDSNNQYLGAFYNGQNADNGIRFSETAQAWSFNGTTLMHLAVSDASSSKDYYLTWEKDSDIKDKPYTGNANLFTIRSSGDTITFYLADVADTDVPGGNETPDTPDVPETPDAVNGTFTKANGIEDGKTYVIIAEGMGMTATAHGGYTNNTGYSYSGFAGTAVTVAENKITSAVTKDMLWTAEAVEGGFAFKNESNDQYLSAFYVGEGSNGIEFSTTAQAWTLDGANLKSVATDKKLTWDNNVNNIETGSDDLFTIRSSSDTITLYLAEITEEECQHDWADATCTEPKTCSVCNETEGEANGHDWADATCTEPKTCEVCNETEGEALGHDWADATCTEPKTCEVCNETEGEALGHSFTTYTSDNNATCTADGTKTATCDNENCEETDTIADTGSKLDHDWADKLSKDAEAHWYDCSLCDEVKDRATHDFGEDSVCVCGYVYNHVHELTFVPANDPSCTEDGNNAYYTCSGCDDLFEDAEGTVIIEDKESLKISSLGHSFSGATCTDPKTCSVCGATEGEANGHSFTNYTSNNNATCTADGTKTAKCDNCDETDTVVDEGSAGHKWVDVTCTDPKTCSVCGATEGEALGHEFADATCTEAKTCTVCGATEGEALGHDWADATCTEAKTCTVCGATEGEALGHDWADATCTEAKTCTVCGATEGEALGHDWADATCTEAKTCTACGATEGEALGHEFADATCTEAKTCTVCGATEGVALGHSFTNYVPNGDEKCLEDGTKTAKCDRCEATDTKVDAGSAGHKWVDADCENAKTCSVCQETDGNPLGHKWADATCTTPETCTVCGKTGAAALGHDFADATDVLPEICNNCGMTNNVKVQFIITADKDEAKIGDTITYTVSVGPVYKLAGIEFQLDIPDGLTFVSGALVPGVQQTLGAGACNFNDKNQKVVIGGGMAYTSDEATPVLTFTCTVDDEFFGNLLMSVDTDNWYIEDVYHVVEIVLANEDSEVYVACTHPGTTNHDAVASTCTVPGHEAYKTCNECGAVVEGSNEPLELDPDNHGNVVTYEAVAGTCLQKGHAEYTKCEDCDVIVTGSDEPTVDPHGNNRSTDEKYLKSVADCHSGAVYYMHCGECGEANVTATFVSGSPIAHSWTDATCTEARICTLCGTINGNALGHNWKDATYDEPKTCERCGITEGEPLAKFSVSGTVTSFDNEDDAITVQLIDSEGTVVHTATVYGNNAEYFVSDVKPGTYTMTFSKNNHVTRSYTVTVGTANTTHDAMISMLGDVNLDGRISLIDCNMIYNHVAGTSIITDEYAFICADVNVDGKLDIDDYEMLYNHLLGI